MAQESSVRTPAIFARNLRIWSGLFLLAYVTSHLTNLSFGLISIDAMDRARPYLSGIWTGPVMGLVLLSALIVHFALGLWALYIRPTLKTNAHDIVQLLTGVLIVPLLATHVVGVSMAGNAGLELGYADTIRLFWLFAPGIGLTQVIMLSVVWVHGCAGLFTWLRSKETAHGILPWLYLLAVVIPVVALLGYAEAGREMLSAGQAGDPLAQNPPLPEGVEVPFAWIKDVTNAVIWGGLLLAAVTFAARLVRLSLQQNQPVLLVRNGASEVHSTSAVSMLDGFLQAGQPHANLCSGRGRCGTCAVRVLGSEFPLPLPSAMELQTLYLVGAPQGARLACQLRPTGGKVEVEALYPADYTFEDERPVQEDPLPEAPA